MKREHFISACREGNTGIIRRQLEAGANVDTKDEYGEPVLSIVSAEGNIGNVQLLLERGANIASKHTLTGATPIFGACIGGNLNVVELLIKWGMNCDSKVNVVEWRTGITPIMGACAGGHITTIQCLIENGANIESVCDDGSTPLMWAASSKKQRAMSLLISCGASVTAKDVSVM
jgi:ankyrin repeat protein